MIIAFKKLIMAYEAIDNNNTLTFKTMVKNGFPLPNNFKQNIPISINDSVVEYLNRCLKLIPKVSYKKTQVVLKPTIYSEVEE